MKIEHLILKYQEKGITFSVEDNKLKYSSPKGAINKEAIDEIKKQKMELIEYIKNNPSKIVVDIDNKYKEFPLTDIQSAYLVGRNSVYEYGGIGCKIYSEFEFPKIDILRLEAAWEKVIENNDMLHAVIHNNGTQSILENYKIPRITNWNLESLDENEIDKHFKNIRERLIKKQYHPEKWPLFDLELSEFKEKSIIHFSLDMLIADFTSINLIVKELEECYFNINMKNKEYRKMLSFRDVMIYDRNRKNNPEYINKRKHDKQYWTDRVKKLPCSPILPIDSMKEKNVSITQFNTIINKDNYKKLKQLAKDERVTVSNILLSLYIEILSYWSQQKSFCINVTISNRPPIHSEINNIIGDFTVNDILEVKDINDCNFIERVKAVQKQLFDDISHLSFTGIEVIREMKKIYGKSFTMPFVYTSTLGLDNSDDRKNYKSKLVYKISQTPQVLIDCQVMEHNEEILITWDVRNNIFPDKIIEHMFSMYENILAKIVKGNVFNEKNIVGLPLEMKTKRDEINNNKKYFKEEALHEGFLNNVKIHPDLEALNIENKSYSYEDLYLYANAVRNVLIEKGAKYGDIIIVELDKGIWQIASVIGILMIGGVYLPIDNEQPVERKNQIKIDSKSKFVITYGADNINKANNLIEINVNEICTFEHSGIISEKVDPSNPAYIIYTSGSTGVPKGVVISHRAAMNTINDIIDRFNITKDDKVLAVANLAFDLSVFDIFAILKVGGSIILPDGKKNPSEWAKLVIDNSVTIWNSVPAQIQMLLSYLESENIKNIQSLRLILLSGDWIPVKLPERLNKIFDKALIVSLGGATEASIWSIYYNIDLKRKYFKSIPYGRPLSNQSFYVLDSNLKECPDWVKGELYIGGDGLAIEYLNEKKITDSKFIYHKILNKRLYRTGDLGRYMPDGNIEFLGREDNQLKIRGHRIELNEIQSVIESHPYVENSIIISFSENKDKIAAFVQPIMEESGVLQKKLIDLKKVISEKSNGVSLHISNDKLNKWLEISNKTPLLDIINLFLKLDIFTDAKRGYSLNEICEKVDVIESYRPLLKR
ncbi:amino acid adenylation domain-containing protein, partial [Clostridium sp.]